MRTLVGPSKILKYVGFYSLWVLATAIHEQEVIADKLNSKPKVIYSRAMQHAPSGSWPAATVQADALVICCRWEIYVMGREESYVTLSANHSPLNTVK